MAWDLWLNWPWNHFGGGVVGPSMKFWLWACERDIFWREEESEIFWVWRREIFLAWFMKKREKTIWFDIWCSNSVTCRLFLKSKLVIFNNFWRCLVFLQTSGEVSRIYPKKNDKQHLTFDIKMSWSMTSSIRLQVVVSGYCVLTTYWSS